MSDRRHARPRGRAPHVQSETGGLRGKRMPGKFGSLRRRLLRTTAPLVLAGVLLAGCNSVWLDPYLDPPEEQARLSRESRLLPQLLAAGQRGEALQRRAGSHRNELVVGQSVLKYGAFGLATAAGVSALYSAHRDLILGLSLGAAGSFGAGSLFASQDRVGIYLAAGRAFGCVVATADSAIATADSLARQKTIYDRTNGQLLSLTGGNSTPQVKTAIAEYETAIRNFEAYLALDATFASSVRRATDIILEAMNKRISDTEASFDSILKVAQNIGPVGVAYATAAAPATADRSKTVAAVESPPPDPETVAKLAADLQAAAKTINDGIAAATNSIAQIGLVCVLDLPPDGQLTLSQAEVTVGENQTVTVVAQGGKTPLTFTWLGATPAEGALQVVPTGQRDFVLIGRKVEGGKTYKMLIRDALAAPQSVTLTVKTPQ